MLKVSWSDFCRDLPLLLVVVCVFMAVFTWDPAVLILLAVVVVNILIVTGLKAVIQQKRPDGSSTQACSKMGSGFQASADKYGMPSSHTQVSFAFFTFVIVLLVWRILPNVPKDSWKRQAIMFGTIPLFALAPLFVAYQRVHTSCHTLQQVAVGAILGIGTAVGIAYLARHLLKPQIRCNTTVI
jgi:membrane-associated phospholipid phosphatase